MNWKKYCRAKGIRFVYEGPYDVIFTLTNGRKFANDTNRRIVEDIDEMSNRELEHILSCE